MPRTIEVIVPTEKTDQLLEHMHDLHGVVGLALQRGTSLDPPGDVLTIQATNDGARTVLTALTDFEIMNGGSIRTSQPRSVISPPYQDGIDRESNETIWEEMGFLLRRETNLSANYLTLMGLSGGIAAVGLWTNTLHIVIGAMVVAPGFEPLLRIPFGIIGGPRVLTSRGIISTIAGYLILALGAALTLLILQFMDPSTTPDLEARSWIQYWSTLTPSGVLLAAIAGAAGAVTVTAQRSVLSAGVMIALALIPAMSIAGMALVVGNLPLVLLGLMRWVVDAVLVILMGALVLGLKQALIHRRSSLS